LNKIKIVLAVLVGCLLLTFVSIILTRPVNTLGFEKKIELIDSYLISSEYKKAIKQINKIVGIDKNAIYALQVYKRLYRYTELTADFKSAAHTSNRLSERYETNEEIQVLDYYFKLRSGTDVSTKYINEKYNSLVLESGANDVAPVNGDFYRYLYEYDKNTAYLINASLYDSVDGYFEKSSDFLKNELELTPLDLTARLLYEIDSYDEALSYIQTALIQNVRNPELYLLKADILLKKEKLLPAAIEYNRIIDRFPEYSWKPYFNMARIKSYYGNYDEAYVYLQRGRLLFPDNFYLVLFLIMLEKQHKIETGGEMILDEYIENTEDPEAKLFQYKYYPEPMTPEKYSALLWKQYNKSPKNESVSRHLIYFLLTIKDIPGAFFLLDQLEDKSSEQSSWYSLLKGVSMAMSGDYKGAVKQFDSISDMWQAGYNSSLCLASLGEYEKALEKMNKCLSLYELDDNKLKSVLYSRTAEFNLLSDHIDAASKRIKEALAYDKSNIHARAVQHLIRLSE